MVLILVPHMDPSCQVSVAAQSMFWQYMSTLQIYLMSKPEKRLFVSCIAFIWLKRKRKKHDLCINLVVSCRLLQGASHIAGCSWDSGQKWHYRWGTRRTPPLRCNTTSHHDLQSVRQGKCGDNVFNMKITEFPMRLTSSNFMIQKRPSSLQVSFPVKIH